MKGKKNTKHSQHVCPSNLGWSAGTSSCLFQIHEVKNEHNSHFCTTKITSNYSQTMTFLTYILLHRVAQWH